MQINPKLNNSNAWKWKVKVKSLRPGFSVHGILEARVLEWVAIAFSSKQYYWRLKGIRTRPLRFSVNYMCGNMSHVSEISTDSNFWYSKDCHQVKLNVSKWQLPIREMWEEVQGTETVWGGWSECLPKPLEGIKLKLSSLSLTNTTPCICLLFCAHVPPVSLLNGILVWLGRWSCGQLWALLPLAARGTVSWLCEATQCRG